MTNNWNNEMHKQVMQLTADAMRAADGGAVAADLMQLVIQRAVVYGHQECMRRLREQGMLVDVDAPAPGRTFAVTRHGDGTETVRRYAPLRVVK